MKRLISVLLIALILLAGCKREKDDVLNQNLVNDGVETSPVVSLPQAENQPEKDPAPAPEPKPETKPEPKPEVKPETKPEHATEVEFKVLKFQVSKNSVAGIEVPTNQVITSLEQLDKYDSDFEKFYSSHSDASFNKGFKKTVRKKYEFKTFSTDDYFDVLKEKDILVFNYQFTRASCEYEVTSVLSNGEVNVEITEYWKDSDLYGYNYIVFIVEVPKGSVDKITSVKTTTKKASNDTYIDFESKVIRIAHPRMIEGPFPDFEVIESVEQLNAHMEKYYGLFDGEYFYGSELSKYTDEYFEKNVVVIKTFSGSSSVNHSILAITDQGGIVYSSASSGNIISSDSVGRAVIAHVDRSLLKGELHIKQIIKGF